MISCTAEDWGVFGNAGRKPFSEQDAIVAIIGYVDLIPAVFLTVAADQPCGTARSEGCFRTDENIGVCVGSMDANKPCICCGDVDAQYSILCDEGWELCSPKLEEIPIGGGGIEFVGEI